MELKICHLYPDILNLNGDAGNILCLRKRLEWRGIGCSVTELPLGESADLHQFDLFYMGGGQDHERTVLLADLAGGKAANIRGAVEDEKVFLAICGGYQLMGSHFLDLDGQQFDCIGALDLYTEVRQTRLTGNCMFRCGAESGGSIAVGFENHSGYTYLGAGIAPLGTVLAGHGNNGTDGTEGCRYKNLFGSYSHGPLLPKNPELADHILLTALRRKDPNIQLPPLPDVEEHKAHQIIFKRLGGDHA